MSRRITRSAKGEEVDFDLLETKQKMEENKPRTLEVRQREDFVHTKRRSRGRRAVMDRLRESKRESAAESKVENKVEKESPKSEKSDTSTDKSNTSKKKSKRRVVKKDEE